MFKACFSIYFFFTFCTIKHLCCTVHSSPSRAPPSQSSAWGPPRRSTTWCPRWRACRRPRSVPRWRSSPTPCLQLTDKMCVKDTLQLTHRQTNCGKDTQKRKALSEEVIIGSWEGGLSNNNYTRGSAVNMWIQDFSGWKFQPSSNNLSLVARQDLIATNNVWTWSNEGIFLA